MIPGIIRLYLFCVWGVLLIGSSGCSSGKSEPVIDLRREDKVSLRDFVDSIDIIQLETRPECLISSISKVIPYRNNYYIFDSRQQEIVCFDRYGHFIFKISKKGRGPEEYTYLGDFNIDPFSGQLLLLVPFGEILYFDPEGRFLSKTRLPEEIKAYNEVYVLNKDELLFVSAARYGAVIYSRPDNKITGTLFPTDPYSNFSPVIYAYKDSVYFSPVLDNDILCATDKFKKRYTWNFGALNITSSQVEKVNAYTKLQSKKGRLSMSEMITKENLIHYYIYGNSESSRYRMAILESGAGMKTVMVDKTTKQHRVFSRTVESVNFVFNGLYDDTVILWDYGVRNIYYAKELLSPEQLEIVESRLDSDNPLLAIYKLKQ